MTERWLTLPTRAGIRSPELAQLVEQSGRDYARAFDGCESPTLLIEMAAASGMPTEVVVGAASKACADAWGHWSGGATDARPMQIVNGVDRWLARQAGFEDIWSTWELAEQVRGEVRAWHQTQKGAVIANAILAAVDSVHALSARARDLAEPEPGHDQHDPNRYAHKNAAAENQALLHDVAEVVRLATSAGSWFHSHTTPQASSTDHEKYAMQILGFVIRQHLDADDVVQGLRDRLR